MNYKKYKPSGIEWIGEIPEHWEVKRIKYVADINGGYAFKSEYFENEGYPVVRIGDVAPKINFENCIKTREENIPNEFKLRKNDVLIALSGATVGKMCFINEDYEAFVNQRVARVNNGSKYLYFTLISNFLLEQILLAAGGSAQENISTNTIGNFFIPTPILSEQILIANFLDDKTEKIDSLIEKKKKLIELYKEERTAVINQAVTRGINPNVKLKPSGIDWLGEIPEHWNFGSLKWNSKIYSGGTPSRMNSDYWKDGTIPWLNSGTVNQIFITEPSEFITEQALNESSAKWIPKYSIVIALAGQGKTKGMAAQILLDTTCNQSMAAIIPNQRFENRFLLYWLQRNYQNIRNLGGGDLRDGLNLEMIGSIKTPIPPMTEQSQIIEEIETEATRIDEKIVEIEKEIELLQEYRTALISEVVTGKIKIIDNS